MSVNVANIEMTNGARFVPTVDLTNSLANQHEVNLCLFQSPVTHPQNAFAFLRLQEVVHMFTQLAREVLCDCQFVLRISSRQEFVNTMTENIEAHICTCKFNNSDMKQTCDFPEDKGNCFPDSLRKLTREFGNEVTSSSWETRRASVEFRTEQSLQTLHSETLRQKQIKNMLDHIGT